MATTAALLQMASAHPGAADEGSDRPSEYVDGAAAALAADFGLTSADANERIARQARSSEFAERVAGLYPATYAGSYIDHRRDDRIVLRFTQDPGELSTVARTFSLDEQQFSIDTGAKHSFAYLRGVTRSFRLQADRKRPYSINPDFMTDTIRVSRLGPGLTSADRTEIARMRATFGIDIESDERPTTAGVDPFVACTDDQDIAHCDLPLRGGVWTESDDAGPCTTGVNVRSASDSKRYIMTAGHCLVDGANDVSPWYAQTSTHYQFLIGKQHNYTFGATGDWGIVKVNDNVTRVPRVFVQKSSGVRPTARDENYNITGVGFASSTIYGYVCKLGANNSTGCGQILNVGQNGNGVQGTAVAQIVSGYSVCHGDSGGPVIAAGKAYGLVSSLEGAAIDANGCANYYYFVGMTAALTNMNVLLDTA